MLRSARRSSCTPNCSLRFSNLQDGTTRFTVIRNGPLSTIGLLIELIVIRLGRASELAGAGITIEMMFALGTVQVRDALALLSRQLRLVVVGIV